MIPITNILGFGALLFFIIGLLPTNARIVFPIFKKSSIHKILVKNRRYIGLSAFWLGLGHTYLIIRQSDFNLYDLYTARNFISGLILLISFLIMAITSNNRSQKKLGIKNWRRLHHWLSYISLFALGWHVLDKMRSHYNALTWLALILIVSIAILYGLRKDIEFEFLTPITYKSQKKKFHE